MREIRSNAMKRSKYARKIHNDHRSTKYSHHYERGKNQDARILHMAMNQVDDIPTDVKATFKGFINAVSVVMLIWILIGSYMYFLS